MLWFGISDAIVLLAMQNSKENTINERRPFMSGAKPFSRALVAAFMLFAAVLIVTGCSKSPVAPSAEDSEPQLLQRSMESVGSFKTLSFYTEQVISADSGGVIEFYDVIMEIPPGAVDSDTLFSINIPDINVFLNEFGTSGLEFNVPVTVTMSYRDADLSEIVEETIRIAYFNANTGVFESVVCVLDTVNKVVIAELSHFSAYGLISDAKIDPRFL
jgi:hypothetical protein